MFGFLNRSIRLRNNAVAKDEVLNQGLSLAMAWGSDWLQPIQERLKAKYPALSESELNEFNEICQSAMKFGRRIVYEMASQSGKDTKQDEFAVVIRARYPWVSKANISSLFSQGMYYAWKDGGL